MIVNTLTTTGRSTRPVWNTSKSSNHLKHSHLCSRVCCLLYVNSESIERYFLYRSTWPTRKLLFCSFLASHFRTDWVLLPNESGNWTRVLSLCTMGQPSFVYKRGIFQKITFRYHDAPTSLDSSVANHGESIACSTTRCLVETSLRCFHENKGSGFSPVVALLFIPWFQMIKAIVQFDFREQNKQYIHGIGCTPETKSSIAHSSKWRR